MSTIDKVALFQQAFGLTTQAEKTSTPYLPEVGDDVKDSLVRIRNQLQDAATYCMQAASDLRTVGRKDEALLMLRLQLMTEELGEVTAAMVNGDLSNLAHELADLDYVLQGTILSLGLGLIHGRVVDEIHRANMSKLGPDGRPILNPAGRVIKSENFKPANVGPIVRGEPSE